MEVRCGRGGQHVLYLWRQSGRSFPAVRQRPRGVGVKTIFGAVIGGVIGHQIGGGRGNDIATVAGTLIGASVAKDAAIRNAGYGTREYSRPVTRCKTSYQSCDVLGKFSNFFLIHLSLPKMECDDFLCDVYYIAK